MAEPLADRVIRRIGQAADLHYRLFMLVAPADAGKTAAIQNVHERTAAPLVNVNLELSRRMPDLNFLRKKTDYIDHLRTGHRRGKTRDAQDSVAGHEHEEAAQPKRADQPGIIDYDGYWTTLRENPSFRDTWELGIHSYLDYPRDRLLLARELPTESGSIFFHINDENVHGG